MASLDLRADGVDLLLLLLLLRSSLPGLVVPLLDVVVTVTGEWTVRPGFENTASPMGVRRTIGEEGRPRVKADH